MIPFNFPTIARRNHIIGLSTPIILGMVSINVIDIVDTAMIGFLGNKALAGVGGKLFILGMLYNDYRDRFSGTNSYRKTVGRRSIIELWTSIKRRVNDDANFCHSYYDRDV